MTSPLSNWRIKTTVVSVQRLKNTRDGNPAYQFNTEDGNFRTKQSSACAYKMIPEPTDKVELLIGPNREVLDFQIFIPNHSQN